MPVIQTPIERFDNLPDYSFGAHFCTVVANNQRVQMHYVDEGAGAETILCLHGEPSWSFLYRHLIKALSPQARVIAPDLIGFGKSDKFTEISEYSVQMHYDTLLQFIEALDLQAVTLVCQDWGGILGLPIAAAHPHRFKRLVIMNTGLPTGDIPMTEGFIRWRDFAQQQGRELPVGTLFQLSTTPRHKLSAAVESAYDAPFPDARYKAGVAAFPLLIPTEPDAEGAHLIRAGREALKSWQQPTLVMFSDGDPVTKGGDAWFRRLIPAAAQQPAIVIEGAGHFLQEEAGATIADHIQAFIERT